MAIFQKRLEGLTNDETYFAKVFTVNHKERVNNRVDLPFASAMPRASRLPDGYTELAYIQSSGTQYIDTGIKPSANLVLKMSFVPNSDTWNNYAVFGSAWSESGFMLNTVNQPNLVFYSKGYNKQAAGIADGLNVVECSQSKFVVNETSYAMSGTGSDATYNIYLFWVGNASYPSNKGRLALYSCQMYDNNILIRDFVPCVSDAEGVGLFDLVSKTFYKNLGSGSFNAGPAV